MGRSSDRAAMQRAHYNGATAIVTGAASGIGKAISTELVLRGATVLISDIDEDGAKEVADDLRRRGQAAGSGNALSASLDVTDADAVADVVRRFAAEHGGLDFIFNNAGIPVGGEVSDLTVGHWRRVVDVNLMSVVHGVSAAYPLMIEQRRGHIVNTASLAGLVPSPMLVPYSTTKHAVVGLSVGLRMEAATHGVKVTAVCPGVIDTPLLDKGNPADLPFAPSTPDIRALLTELVGAPYPPASLARDVLDGVALNRPIIVAPRRAKVVWALYRISPKLIVDQSRKPIPITHHRATGG